jgi:hypothetical protein
LTDGADSRTRFAMSSYVRRPSSISSERILRSVASMARILAHMAGEIAIDVIRTPA